MSVNTSAFIPFHLFNCDISLINEDIIPATFNLHN